jgi:hypothetical protein
VLSVASSSRIEPFRIAKDMRRASGRAGRINPDVNIMIGF